MKTNVKHAAKKQAIMDTATSMMEDRGYLNITVRDICAEAKISVGTFYHYFNEKDELVVELFRGIDNFFRNEVEPAFTDNELQNILIFAENYALYCQRSGVEVNKKISCAPMNNTAEDYLSDKRLLAVIMDGVVTRGQAKGQITREFAPREIRQMVLVMIRGYCSDWAKRAGSYDIVEATHNHMTLFIRGLVPLEQPTD